MHKRAGLTQRCCKRRNVGVWPPTVWLKPCKETYWEVPWDELLNPDLIALLEGQLLFYTLSVECGCQEQPEATMIFAFVAPGASVFAMYPVYNNEMEHLAPECYSDQEVLRFATGWDNWDPSSSRATPQKFTCVAGP